MYKKLLKMSLCLTPLLMCEPRPAVGMYSVQRAIEEGNEEFRRYRQATERRADADAAYRAREHARRMALDPAYRAWCEDQQRTREEREKKKREEQKREEQEREKAQRAWDESPRGREMRKMEADRRSREAFKTLVVGVGASVVVGVGSVLVFHVTLGGGVFLGFCAFITKLASDA